MYAGCPAPVTLTVTMQFVGLRVIVANAWLLDWARSGEVAMTDIDLAKVKATLTEWLPAMCATPCH